MEISLFIGLLLVLTAFFCEYADSTLGMGYGTTMTPILLLIGFDPLQLVPIVLMSEIITGATAGLCHHNEGNINLREKTNLQIILALSFCGLLGSVIAVTLAIQLPKSLVKFYIAFLVLGIGCFMLIMRNKKFIFSWKKIWLIGLLASFNKGISGGGYGPRVCPGQILSGVNGNVAVAITSISESATCLAAALLYVFLSQKEISWELLPWIATGALLSVPLSAKSVKFLPEKSFQMIIAIFAITLGVFSLIKILC